MKQDHEAIFFLDDPKPCRYVEECQCVKNTVTHDIVRTEDDARTENKKEGEHIENRFFGIEEIFYGKQEKKSRHTVK